MRIIKTDTKFLRRNSSQNQPFQQRPSVELQQTFNDESFNNRTSLKIINKNSSNQRINNFLKQSTSNFLSPQSSSQALQSLSKIPTNQSETQQGPFFKRFRQSIRMPQKSEKQNKIRKVFIGRPQERKPSISLIEGDEAESYSSDKFLNPSQPTNLFVLSSKRIQSTKNITKNHRTPKYKKLINQYLNVQHNLQELYDQQVKYTQKLKDEELLRSKSQDKNKLNEFDLNRSCFRFCFLIGIGESGLVWKVEYLPTRLFFAMKIKNKQKLIQKELVNQAINEQKILKSISNPFIANLCCSFQDTENLYLVTLLCKGQVLRYHLECNTKFNEKQSSNNIFLRKTYIIEFICANIIQALHYLHSKNIIFRNLSPENLVFDTNGYMRLLDFSDAAILTQQNYNQTGGTLGYVAPELLFKQAHSFSVDYFSLGVICYELMMGRKPYIFNNRQDLCHQLMEQQIQIQKSQIPENWSLTAADFVNRLIQIEPKHRLGNGSDQEVLNHAWFSGFQWNLFLKKELYAPFIPQSIENNISFKLDMKIFEDQQINNENNNRKIYKSTNHQSIIKFFTLQQEQFQGYEFINVEQLGLKKLSTTECRDYLGIHSNFTTQIIKNKNNQ